MDIDVGPEQPASKPVTMTLELADIAGGIALSAAPGVAGFGSRKFPAGWVFDGVLTLNGTVTRE